MIREEIEKILKPIHKYPDFEYDQTGCLATHDEYGNYVGDKPSKYGKYDLSKCDCGVKEIVDQLVELVERENEKEASKHAIRCMKVIEAKHRQDLEGLKKWIRGNYYESDNWNDVVDRGDLIKEINQLIKENE